MEKNVEVNSITGAIKSLLINVDKSSITVEEKKLLKTLLEKIYAYYVSKSNEIEKRYDVKNINYKEAILISEIISYIMTINDTLLEKYNVLDVVNVIQKEIGNQKKITRKKR